MIMSEQRSSDSVSRDASTPDAPTEPNDRAVRSESPDDAAAEAPESPREYGGRKGPEPVRYGDWEKNGRCIDF